MLTTFAVHSPRIVEDGRARVLMGLAGDEEQTQQTPLRCFIIERCPQIRSGTVPPLPTAPADAVLFFFGEAGINNGDY
jgi:hypothetical protein